MSQNCLVIAALSFLLACPSQNDSPQPATKPQKNVLQEMYVDPENFQLGQEVEVTGALIRPTRTSAKFICKELRLPVSGSPVAGSTCVAVSGLREKCGGGLNIHKLSGANGTKRGPGFRTESRCHVQSKRSCQERLRRDLSCRAIGHRSQTVAERP